MLFNSIEQGFLVILGAFVLMIIVATVLAYSKKIHPPLRSRFFNFLLTIGIIGLVFSFFRWESIAFVGTRFAMAFLIASAIVWYLTIAYYTIFKMPKEIKIIKANARYAQYLPKKKNKR